MTQHHDVGEDASSAAVRVLERLRVLAGELDPLERSVLAALIGPGISELVRTEAEDGLVDWAPDALPAALVAIAHRHPRTITGQTPP